MKSVIIVAMCDTYSDPVPEGTEVWVLNKAYRHQDNATHLYFFDSLAHFVHNDDKFCGEVNSLGIPVICRKEYPELWNSQAFDLDGLVEHFNDTKYYTCTVAYMIADAIRQGFESITLWGMYHQLDSWEYMLAKPCVEYWVGVARGRGIDVRLWPDSALCKPWSWEAGLYGYYYNANQWLANTTMGATYKACHEYPHNWCDAKDGPDARLDVAGSIANVERMERQLSEAQGMIAPALGAKETISKEG